MGLRERLLELVPDNLKPPIRSTSYPDFLNALITQNASLVVATPGRKRLFVTGSSIGQYGENYEYNITFIGTGQRGRRIDYYHACVRKFLDNPDYRYIHGGKMGAARLIHDLEEAYLLTTFVTADTKLQEIRQALPECVAELKDSDKTFTDQDYAQLRREAQRLQLRPWEDPRPSD